jgi:hypothetical protein
MGRKRQWAEDMVARFIAGTFARIAAVLGDGEDRTDFVRAAVDRELRRREASRKASRNPPTEKRSLPPNVEKTESGA